MMKLMVTSHHSSFNFQFSECQHCKSGHDSKFKRRKSHISTNISKHCINLQTTRGASEFPHNLSIYSHWNKTNAGSNVGNKSREIPKIHQKVRPPYATPLRLPWSMGMGPTMGGPLEKSPWLSIFVEVPTESQTCFLGALRIAMGKKGHQKKCWATGEQPMGHTVDGRNPKQPPGMVKTLEIMGYNHHPWWCRILSINSTTILHKDISCFHLTHLTELFNQFNEDCWYTN